MAEVQSTDGSFFSRETDEEKSLESIEDMLSMIAEIGKETDIIDGKEKLVGDVGHGNVDKDALTGSKQSPESADTRKKGDELDENDKGNTSDITNEVRKAKKKKIEKRSHRHEPTLFAIERYLKSGNCFGDTLEYEEVSSFNSKIHRYAVERTRGRQDMFFREETIQNGDDANVTINPIIMTEEDIAQERLYHQIYQKEEYYAVATKFLKTVIDGAHGSGGPNFVLHTKTANWLKRAAGMQRKYDPWYEKEDNQQRNPAISEDSDDGEGEAVSWGAAGGNDRRVTRRRVQMTRKKRRLERMEKETESFRILSEVALDLSKRSRVGRTKKGFKRSYFTINDITDDDEDPKIDKTPKEIGESASDEPVPSIESIGLATICDPHIRDEDLERHLLDGEKEESHTMEGSLLPPLVARLGLEFCPRPLTLEKSSRTYTDGGSDMRVPDRTRARKSRKLINALSNKRVRRWAMYEFFYSDVDKEWYRNDGFASDLAKHGLPIDAMTRLTRQEWSLVRRQIRPRFRVFSKRFIAEQLKRRNRHRALVRTLQQDPMMEKFKPIAVGTPVTAFDKRSHTIRRGRVLLHDPKNHSYLVQFNDQDSGCDVVLDFEVSVSLPATTRPTHATPSYPSLYKPHKELSSTMGVAELVLPKGIVDGGCTEDIERELLISSVVVATEAFERKKVILEALENCADSTIEGAAKYCHQLLANLDRINSTLEAALAYIQVLYGKVYGSPISKHEIPNGEIKKMKLDAEIPKSKEFEKLVASLEAISSKIGAVALSSTDEDKNKSSFSPSEFLRNDLSSSTSLLLLSNYLAETSSLLASSEIEKTTYSQAMNAALKTLIDRYSTICLPPTQETSLVGKKLEQESHVEDELKDLWFAVGMLRTETALATDESRAFEFSNAIVK